MTTVEIMEKLHGMIEQQNDIILALFERLSQHIDADEAEEIRRRYRIGG